MFCRSVQALCPVKKGNRTRFGCGAMHFDAKLCVHVRKKMVLAGASRRQCARCAVEQRALVEQTRSEAALLCESFNCARGRFVVRARQRAPALAKEADVCRAVEFRRWATLCSAELRWIQRLEESGGGGRRPQVAQRESV